MAAWGSNYEGQLGNTSTTNSSVPVLVNRTGVISGKTVVAVSAGVHDHSLALCSDGTVAAWGSNYGGQLGNNSTTNSSVPVLVSRIGVLSGKTVVAVSAGGDHSLALCSDGTVAAWGKNYNGTLAESSWTDSLIPVLAEKTGVPTGVKVQSIAAGTDYSIVTGSGFSYVSGSISLSAGTLYPQFDSLNLQSYNAYVPNTVQSIFVTGTFAEAAAVKVNDNVTASGSQSAPIQLNLGGNVITVLVVAQDTNIVNTYTINVTRLPSSVSTLAGLTLGMGTLSPMFGAATTSYSASVPNATSSITVAPTVTDSTATVKVNGTAVASGSASIPISLNVGANTISVLVTAHDGATTKTYTISVTRLPSSVSTLAGLTLGTGTLSPMFGAATTSYSASVPNATSSITVAPTVTDSTATVKVNGTAVASGSASIPISLNVGANTISVLVTAHDGATTKTYTISVTRLPSSVSTLAGLTLGTGTLSPMFGAATTSYSASVPNATSSITVAPTVTDSTATVKVNGAAVASGSESGPISLNVGSNTITVIVTAQDSTTTRAYTINVTRQSSEAGLSSLTLSSGSLSPAFSSGTTSYTTSINDSVSSIRLTPVAKDAYATVKVNGITVASGSVSQSIPLGADAGVITIVVTAQDPNFTKTYTATVAERVLTSTERALVTASSYSAAGDIPLLKLGFAPPTGADLTLVNNTGLGFISGQFQNLKQGQQVAMSYGGVEYCFVADYFGGTGNDLVLCWADNQIIGWGENQDGQLGIGGSSDSLVPTDLVASGILSGKNARMLASGRAHTLALTEDGTLCSWGSNSSGQLGNSNTFDSSVAVDVTIPDFLMGKEIATVAAGGDASYVLCSDGTLAAWGENSSGQLGDGLSRVNSLVPLNLTGKGALATRTVVAIVAGNEHCLALCDDGRVVAWGANAHGQLGCGDTASTNPPRLVIANGVLAGKNVVSITAGWKHSMALCSDGSIAAWGGNDFGQLGNYSTADSSVPVSVLKIAGLSGKTVTGISAGGSHSLAVTSDGSVAAWGLNSSGQLGNGGNNNSYVPVGVSRISGALIGKNVTSVSAAFDHSLAICSDGTLVAWGANSNGKLGNNSTTSSNLPVNISTSGVLSSKEVSTVFAGSQQSFVICADGSIVAWGLNSSGQLGDSSLDASLVPVSVVTTSGALFGKTVASVSAGAFHTLVRFSDGTVASWGRNASGQLGDNSATDRDTPVAVYAESVLKSKIVASVQAGESHSIALCSDGTVVTWGDNRSGQLGNGTVIVGSVVPVDVTGMGALADKTVVAVGAGEQHCLALCSDGTLAAWGRGDYGQLGDGAYASSSLPVEVNQSSAVAGKLIEGIYCGAHHNLIRFHDGTLAAWGLNSSGQCGNNTAGNCGSPVLVTRDSGALIGKTVVSAAAGETHSIALCSDGTVAAWGSNVYGQLGTGGGNDSFVPVSVVTNIGALYGKSVAQISCGGFHSLALCSDGGLVSWGQGSSGQLGTNSLTASGIPSSVVRAGSLGRGRAAFIEAGGATSFSKVAIPLPVLLDLTFDDGVLSPSFSPGIEDYSLSVGNSTDSIRLTGITRSLYDYFLVNDTICVSGIESFPIPLSVGSNLIEITVISEDGSINRVYTIKAERSRTLLLSSLSIGAGFLSPAFNSEKTTYSVGMNEVRASVEITVSAIDSLASIAINGEPAASGVPFIAPLEEGANVLEVVLRSPGDNSEKAYVLHVDNSRFGAWKSRNFALQENLSDPEVSGDAATPAGDGVSNIMKYAFGLDAMDLARGDFTSCDASGQYLLFTYRKNKLATDLVCTVEFSPALQGEWEAASVPVSQIDQGDHDVITVRDKSPLQGKRSRFVRLSVTRQIPGN